MKTRTVKSVLTADRPIYNNKEVVISRNCIKMSISVYLGVRIPGVKYEKVLVEDVSSENPLNTLIPAAAKNFSLEENEIVLVYCGRPLTESTKLEDVGIKPGAHIQVMIKPRIKEEKQQTESPITDEKIKQITALFSKMATKDLWKLSHPEVLIKVLQKFPSLRDNLGALAFLRDPILLSSMKTSESLEQISKQYNILLEAATFLVDTNLDDNQERLIGFEESESSSSDSSSDAEASTSYANNNTRPPSQITRQDLVQALAEAGAASRNSLSNIAQRNFDASQTPSNSSTSQPVANPGPISTSMLNEALQQAALLAGISTNNSNNAPPPSTPATVQDPAVQYARELEQMHEMGLMDDQANLQALQISNGNVESAINLVFNSL